MDEITQPSRLAWHLERLGTVLLGLWVGAMLAIAFLAAPLVFGAVPEWIETKDAAARVIGPAFGRIDGFGALACIVSLLVVLPRRGASGARWRLVVLTLLLISALVDATWLAPAITARTEPLHVYHRAATTLWMFDLIAGTFLLYRGLLPSRRHTD